MKTRVERSVRDLRLRDRRGRDVVIPVRGEQAVVGWKTVMQAGLEVVHEVRLTCLHWHALRNPRPLGENPSRWLDRSYRCAPCGSIAGLQRSSGKDQPERVLREAMEQAEHLRDVLPEVVSDPPRASAMVLFIEAALEARSLPPRDRKQEEVYGRIHRQAMLAGLLPQHRPEDDWGHRA